MAPTVINAARKGYVDERSPFWALRFSKQLHSGFVRKFVPFARVAGDAGADNILPSGLAPAVAREDVIDIEVRAVEECSAVLAGVLVALEDVVSCVLDLLFRQAVEEAKNDDARNADPQ